jgi:hypothetical protein
MYCYRLTFSPLSNDFQLQVPYKAYLTDQFRVASDVYLEIHRRVDIKLDMALDRNLPNPQNRNICPPCFYELDDEPELRFSSFVSMDGNNSLRRWAASAHNNSARIDTRTIESDRWLSAAEVNRFANEVKQKTGSEKQTVSQLLCCECKANR